MVLIKIAGGLGNQLFQFAAAFSIAKNRGQELAFDINSFCNDPYSRSYGLEVFKIDYPTLSSEKINKFLKVDYFGRIINQLKKRESRLYFKVSNLEFNDSILKSNPINQYLDGYYAHPNYFENVRSNLLEKISLKEEYTNFYYKNTIHWIRENKFISVHIRRADYISDPTAYKLFESLGKDYYYRCIKFFESRQENSPKFLFFSDDIDWVKEEFSNVEDANFMDDKNLYKDYYDLMFMAACEHNIIANSTFSWWGAWLNDNPKKIVLAPTVWYKNRTYQDYYERESFLPINWIKI